MGTYLNSLEMLIFVLLYQCYGLCPFDLHLLFAVRIVAVRIIKLKDFVIKF